MVEKTRGGGFDDLRTVNPQAYPFLLINATKELNKKIEEQNAQIKSLQAQIELIKQLLKKE